SDPSVQVEESEPRAWNSHMSEYDSVSWEATGATSNALPPGLLMPCFPVETQRGSYSMFCLHSLYLSASTTKPQQLFSSSPRGP
ncbi:hypothetical protein JOB18_013452, partial [Solea senegalensis]